MDCMAEMPVADGRRCRAVITKDEKVKNSPLIRPAPSAARNVNANSRLSMRAVYSVVRPHTTPPSCPAEVPGFHEFRPCG